MNKKVLYALLIIALTAIVLMLNAGDSVSVSLKFAEIRAMKALVFMFFIGIGVTIGVLLK